MSTARPLMFALVFGMANLAADSAYGQSEPDNKPDVDGPLRKSCKEMLKLQTSINNETKELRKAIDGRAEKKPLAKELEASAKLAARQKDVITMPDQEIALLEKADAARAFIEAFRLLRDDCKAIEGRLRKGDLGKETQAAQTDVEECLTEMIHALRIKCNDDEVEPHS